MNQNLMLRPAHNLFYSEDWIPNAYSTKGSERQKSKAPDKQDLHYHQSRVSYEVQLTCPTWTWVSSMEWE